MSEKDIKLQNALNNAIRDIVDNSEEKCIEDYILDAIKSAFSRSGMRHFMIDYIGKYLKENNK